MSLFKEAKVLVAGGTGFLGVNLIIRLLSLGAKVRATLHLRPLVIRNDRIEYVQADLTQMEDCRKVVEGMDYVFMCAANTSGAAVMATNPLTHVTPNVVMNAQMLEASYLSGVKKFLFISSSAAYPPTGDRPVREDEMFDGDPYDPYYSVGWMKRYAEILCQIYSQKIKKPMATVVIRPSNVYGPYDKYDFNTSHVTAALIRRVVERHDPIRVWGTGDDVRDLIYVDDFVDAVVLSMEKIHTFLPINIGFGKGYSIKKILKTILLVDDYREARVVYDPSLPSMIPVRLVDTSLAETVLGFETKITLEEGLRKTLRWYREKMET